MRNCHWCEKIVAFEKDINGDDFCPVCDRIQPNQTSTKKPTPDPPTEPGWYWYKYSNDGWEMGKVEMGRWCGDVKELIFETADYKMLLSDPDDGLWQGPIYPPEGD